MMCDFDPFAKALLVLLKKKRANTSGAKDRYFAGL
jgi:hypothetical protein